MFNNIFNLLNTVADIGSFVSLKKTFDNNDQLQIIDRLDKQDDIIFNQLLSNQLIIINYLKEISMEIRKIMHKIIENGKQSDMEELSEIFIDMLYDLKDTNKAWYKSIKYKMYKMAYGEHLTEELAHKWVDKMQNKDGTIGEHWSIQETEDVRKQYAPDLNSYDFYAILNSIYSDYYSDKFDTMTYINLAKDWLKDKDGSNCKALKYYMFIFD